MTLKEFINNHQSLHWAKRILRPYSKVIWGVSGEEDWLIKIKKLSGNLNVVFDIGSSSGWFLSRAHQYFPNSAYYHFEPRLDALEKTEKLASKLKSKSYFFHTALSKQNSQGLPFYVMDYLDASTLSFSKTWIMTKTQKIIKVKVTTLDTIFEKLSLRQIDYCKIDVEGHEWEVLQGGSEVLKKNVETLMLEISFLRHKSRNDIVNILKFLFCRGFDLVDTSSNNFLFTKNKKILRYYGKNK